MFLSGLVVITLQLLALNNKVDQLKSRLQMGYQAAEEARQARQAQDYAAAAASLTDALNLGRKPALTLHEMNNDDNQGNEALQWLIQVCCESAELNLEHLNNDNQARSDAWAACLFSQYTQCKPLLLMKAVCVKQDDLLGELQACKQLLNLSNEELSPESAERQAIADRLAEIEKQLAPKLKQ